MAANGTHRCPGCGKPGVAQSRLACRPCWYWLPKELRDAVWAGWRVRMVRPNQHLTAVEQALAWYRRERSAKTANDGGQNPAGKSGRDQVDADTPRGNREEEAHEPQQQKYKNHSLHNPHRSPRVR